MSLSSTMPQAEGRVSRHLVRCQSPRPVTADCDPAAPACALGYGHWDTSGLCVVLVNRTKGQDKEIDSFWKRRNKPAVKKCVCQVREGSPGIPSGCLPAGSPAAPGPCAGSLVGGRAREALGWASAAELGRAPGPKGSSWQAGSAAQRQLCPGAAPLHSAAGLGALTAGGSGRGEKGERNYGLSGICVC